MMTTRQGAEATMARWAGLRQVVFATLDHAADTGQMRKSLGLGPAFADPVLADWNLLDATMPIGSETYVELVSPTTVDHPLRRWLEKVGGARGYVLSTQVPSIDGVKERCAELGIGIVTETEAEGHAVLQLHPRDMGMMLELDVFLPPEGWFWDDLESARVAHSHVGGDVTDIRGIEIAWRDGPALAEKWSAVLGLSFVLLDGDHAVILFGEREIRFTSSTTESGLAAVFVRARDRAKDVGRVEQVCNTEFRFV